MQSGQHRPDEAVAHCRRLSRQPVGTRYMAVRKKVARHICGAIIVQPLFTAIFGREKGPGHAAHECAFVPLARRWLAATRDQLARRQSSRCDGWRAGCADLVDSVLQRLDILQLPVPETEALHEHRAAEVVVPDFPVHLALLLDRPAAAEDLE